MGEPLSNEISFLIIGLLLGGLGAWLIARFRFRALFIAPDKLEKDYIAKALFVHLQQESDLLREDMKEKEEEIRALLGNLSSKDQTILHLDDKLNNQKEVLLKLQEQAHHNFEQIANRLLEEKSKKFSSTHQKELQSLLDPLKEKIKTFEQGIERRFIEETRDRVSLKKELEQLKDLNNQLSQDANNLAAALKGNQKIQGDWGELQLELLLQKAGLEKDIHYLAQNSFRDTQGLLKRPDFIVKLPENKQLIIDAKVSLKAYEQYCNATQEDQKAMALKAHLESIHKHIKDLGSKNYQQLYQINTPDYLLLFIPIDAALGLALSEDHRLFTDALDRNIVIVSTSTLLATMRTVSYIWKQEKQKRNVVEIAYQSGLLYDKFCAFVEDLQQIGTRLDMAQGAYEQAMRKLVESKKRGDTLIGRAEKIKKLGAKASKSLPKELLE